MANTVIAASLTLDSTQATTSVKSFRTELRNAQNNLIQIQEQFGETSVQATAAARAVAGLRDRMNDARAIADAFNPDAKFQAFSKVLQGAAGGVAALTGAMALFGSESQDVQKALLKVQGALALSQGLSQIGELGKSFAILKVIAVDAFNSIKVAIGSTGIGAIVIAVGLLVTYWDDIRMSIGLASREQTKNLEIATKSVALEKDKLDILTSQDNILKQQGKSEQDILNIKNQQLEATIKASIEQLKAQKIISDQALAAANAGSIAGNASSPALGLISKIIFGDPKKVKEAGDKNNHEITLQIEKLQDQLAANQMQIVKSTSDFNQQVLTLNQAAGDAQITDAYQLSQRKLKEAYGSQKEAITLQYTNLQQRNAVLSAADAKYASESTALAKKYAKDKADALNKIAYDTYIVGIQNQEVLGELAIKQQLKTDTEQANYEIANLKDRQAKIEALTKQADAKIADLRAKDLLAFQTKWTAQIAKNAQEDADNFTKFVDDFTSKQENAVIKSKDTILAETLNLNAEIATMNLDAAGQQAAASMEQLNKWYSEKQAALKGNADAELALTKEYERQKTAITEIENNSRLSIIANVLGQAASLFGQATVAGKALAIAQTTIDTYQSATASYKSLAGIPVVGPALGFAAAAVAIAAGLANVKKILSVQVPGVSSGVSSVGGSLSAPLQPQPVRTSTQLPQDQINAIGNSTVRAFIVESDIKDAGERSTRLNRQARLGGN